MKSRDRCYFHLRARGRVLRMSRMRHFDTQAIQIPLLEDAAAVQFGVQQVMQALLEDRIDTRRGGLLLYALQIASGNLKRLHALVDQKPEEAVRCEEYPGYEEDFGLNEPDPRRIPRTLEETLLDEAMSRLDAANAAYDAPLAHGETVTQEERERHRAEIGRLELAVQEAVRVVQLHADARLLRAAEIRAQAEALEARKKADSESPTVVHQSAATTTARVVATDAGHVMSTAAIAVDPKTASGLDDTMGPFAQERVSADQAGVGTEVVARPGKKAPQSTGTRSSRKREAV
jgi:hypothetical protein